MYSTNGEFFCAPLHYTILATGTSSVILSEHE